MKFSEPITFCPLFYERIWGGRMLEKLYAKALPANVPIGESWEFVDREEAQSLVATGQFAERTLNDLWNHLRGEVFGRNYDDYPSRRFPLLIKLLDAREKLSVQVHPPAAVAEELGGEPKTEMWHVLDADPGADIFAGLCEGVTRETFKEGLKSGATADLIHRIPTKTGDTVFIPSGRIHAIGAGNVILEVQQNSDTTYRVFDWNRTGLDGQPRELHIEQSLRSIDFEDYEPDLQQVSGNILVEDLLFKIEKLRLDSSTEDKVDDRFAIYFCISGSVCCGQSTFQAGDFFLLPAASEAAVVANSGGASVAKVTLP